MKQIFKISNFKKSKTLKSKLCIINMIIIIYYQLKKILYRIIFGINPSNNCLPLKLLIISFLPLLIRFNSNPLQELKIFLIKQMSIFLSIDSKY